MWHFLPLGPMASATIFAEGRYMSTREICRPSNPAILELHIALLTSYLGYPFGENVVFPPAPLADMEMSLEHAELGDHPALREFYSASNGLSLPDVHVGYFLERVNDLANEDVIRYTRSWATSPAGS